MRFVSKIFSYDSFFISDSILNSIESFDDNNFDYGFDFDYDYGFDTLGINARFKCDKNYYSKVKKCFSLGTLNNTGRYIKLNNFYKFINFIFFIRILEIFNFKKRNY